MNHRNGERPEKENDDAPPTRPDSPIAQRRAELDEIIPDEASPELLVFYTEMTAPPPDGKAKP